MLYKDEGFIIKKNDILNEDSVVTIFLKKYGKVAVVAKGIKKITSRKRGALELMMYSSFAFAKGKNLDLLTEVKIKETFSAIRDNTQYMYFLFYLAEIVDKMVGENEENSYIFSLLETVCSTLEKNMTIEIQRACSFVNIQMLHFFGVLPDLTLCKVCNMKIEKKDAIIYSDGFAHAMCMHGKVIDISILVFLQYMLTHSLLDIAKVKMSKKLENTIYLLTIVMIEDTIGALLKSKTYIHAN